MEVLADNSPWTAARYLRKTCPYCSTPNLLDNNSCEKCGGPLENIQFGSFQKLVLPLDKALMWKMSNYNDIMFFIKLNGETKKYILDANQLRYSLLYNENYDISVKIVRQLASAFGLPLEFFDWGKWHKIEDLYNWTDIWMRDIE
jgi:hypothetical protein